MTAHLVRTRRRTPGLLVVAATLLVAAPLQYGLWWSAAVVAGLLVVAAAAWRTGQAGTRRAALVALTVGLIYHVAVQTGWPPAVATVLVGAVLLAAWPVFERWPALRPAEPWLIRGRFSADVVAILVALIVLSAVALSLWTMATDPPPPPFLAGFGTAPGWLLVLGAVGFSLVNSVWEEALYRGILQSELTAAWGVGAAIVIQAVAFGIAHLNGFPSGWVGALLSGGWGLLLGVLRHRSGGMLAPYVAHVCADGTIAVLAVVLLL